MKRIFLLIASLFISVTCLAADEAQSIEAVAPAWAAFLGEFIGETTIVADEVGDHTVGQHSPIKIKFAAADNELIITINDERIDQLPEYQITFPDQNEKNEKNEKVMTIAWDGKVLMLPARILFNLNLADNRLSGEQRVTLFSKQRSGRVRERNTIYHLQLQREALKE